VIVVDLIFILNLHRKSWAFIITKEKKFVHSQNKLFAD
jgi:hypothetical protein